jgi:hypothetical protein
MKKHGELVLFVFINIRLYSFHLLAYGEVINASTCSTMGPERGMPA